MSETNLSTFLHIIHDCQKDELKLSGQAIIGQLLAIQKIDIYGDEKLKGIYTGARPIVPSDIDSYTKKDRTAEFKGFFLKILNDNKKDYLFSKFEIDPEDKEDFDLMCEALAAQYQNFTRYGDYANTTVKSIYESILDSHLKETGDKANVDAVVAATRLFYSCVEAALSIKLDGSLFEARTPIETFLRNIYDVFNAFNIRCNHAGRLAYKRVRDDFFKKNSKISEYLKMVSEPGSLPIELENQVTVFLWNCTEGEEQYFLAGNFDYDLEYNREALMTGMKKYIPAEIPEIPFSEYLNIHLKGDNKCLISDFKYLINDVYLLLKTMQAEFKASKECEDINAKIFECIKKINGVQLSLVTDGTYYPKEGRLKYAVTMEMFQSLGDGRIIKTGDDLFTVTNLKHVYSDSFVNMLGNFIAMLMVILTIKHEPKEGEVTPTSQLEDECGTPIMTEIVTLNTNKKCRYFMFPPTCKAKTYRKIREIASLAESDEMLGFLYGQLVTTTAPTLENLMKTSEERMKSGTDYLCAYGYWNKKLYQIVIPMEYINNSSFDMKTGDPHFDERVWDWFKRPEPIKEENVYFLKPLFDAIHENEDKGLTIDYLKD